MTMTTDAAALQSVVEEHIREADAEFGVFIHHLQSGATVEVNADALYLLASVFKIPILLEALAQVEEGKQRLDQRFALRREDQLPTSMILEHLDPGLQLTFRDLLTAMITVSDNTATDMVLAQIGIENVMKRLESWGLRDIAIRMSVKGLFDAAFSWPDSLDTMPQIYRDIVAKGPLVDPFTGVVDERFAAGLERGSNWDAVAAQRSLENNVSSPRATGELLERLVRGELLSRESTGVALDIMLRQQLNARLPRFLPPAARIAHKTGTFYASRNDAGIIYFPDGGRVVIITFGVLQRDLLGLDPLQSVPYIDRVDSAMGRIARSTFDMFAPTSKK